MFLQQLEHLQAARGERTVDIYLPMSRSGIGEYVGISLEDVSRAFRSLSVQGIIKCLDRRHLKILDRAAFEAIPGRCLSESTLMIGVAAGARPLLS
jgi:hypothetical protein